MPQGYIQEIFQLQLIKQFVPKDLRSYAISMTNMTKQL